MNDKYPRSMEEAFGPYNRGQLEPMPDPMHPADEKVLFACAVIAVVAAIFFFAEVFQ
jgi:hypothetical protein